MIFDRARLVNVDFTETRFVGFNAYGSEFDGCDFSGTAFEQPLMGSTGTGIGGQQWDGATWPQTVYRNCTFRRTRFAEQTSFGNVRFERCVFDGSRLRGQTATFEAELDYVAFRHIDLRAQRFPGLPGYVLLDRITERARSVLSLVDGWADERHRKEVRSALEFLVGTAREWNDDQALVSPAHMGRKLPPALREELFDAFRRTTSDTSPD
ncbi:hypothetical protein GCM10020216_032350 [Nonomuraea helvata]